MMAVLQVVLFLRLTQASSCPLNLKPSEIEKEGIPARRQNERLRTVRNPATGRANCKAEGSRRSFNQPTHSIVFAVFGAAPPKKIAAPGVRAAIVRGLRAGPNSSAKLCQGNGTKKRHLARQEQNDLMQFNAHSPMILRKIKHSKI